VCSFFVLLLLGGVVQHVTLYVGLRTYYIQVEPGAKFFSVTRVGVRPNMHFCFLSRGGRDQEFFVTGWAGSVLSRPKQGETRVKNVHVHVQNVLVQVRFLRVFFPCFGLRRYPGDKFFTRGQAPQEPGDKFRTSLARFATRRSERRYGGAASSEALSCLFSPSAPSFDGAGVPKSR